MCDPDREYEVKEQRDVREAIIAVKEAFEDTWHTIWAFIRTTVGYQQESISAL